MINRRELIGLSAKLAALALLKPSRILAEVPRLPRYFVAIHLRGGLDVTLGMDPWIASSANESNPPDKELFIEYTQGQLISFNPEQSTFLGPCLQPLARYKNRFSIVNGIYIEELDVGHETASVVMDTGTDGSAASFPLVCQTRFGGLGIGTGINRPIHIPPNEKAELVSLDVLKPAEASAPLFTLLDPSTYQENGDLRTSVDALVKAGPAFQRSIAQMQSISTRYKIDLEDQAYESTRWGFAAAIGLRNNLFTNSRIALDGERVDSHSGHRKIHFASQTEVFKKVADVFKAFERVASPIPGRSMLDETTFVVYSEFSRTPGLNGADGKDHNLRTNSALLMGPQVVGGLTVGASGHRTTIQTNDIAHHQGLAFNFNDQIPYMTNEGRLLNPKIKHATTLSETERYNPITPAVLIKTLGVALGLRAGTTAEGGQFDFLGPEGNDLGVLKSLIKS